MAVKLVGHRKKYSPKESDEVYCEVHNFRTTWGRLDAIQKLAVEEGLDTKDDMPCLLLQKQAAP